jgi:hypothetical protein
MASSIASTSPELVIWLKDNFKDGVTWKTDAGREKGWKTAYYWRISKSKHVYNILSNVLPYLTIKKTKAMEVMAKIETFKRFKSNPQVLFRKRGKFGETPDVATNLRTIPSRAGKPEGVEVRGEIIPICSAGESQDMTRTIE